MSSLLISPITTFHGLSLAHPSVLLPLPRSLLSRLFPTFRLTSTSRPTSEIRQLTRRWTAIPPQTSAGMSRRQRIRIFLRHHHALSPPRGRRRGPDLGTQAGRRTVSPIVILCGSCITLVVPRRRRLQARQQVDHGRRNDAPRDGRERWTRHAGLLHTLHGGLPNVRLGVENGSEGSQDIVRPSIICYD